MNLKKIFDELQRRNVFKVATAYAIAGWLIIQVAATIAPQLNFPDWVPAFITILVLCGFPIALIFAWAFELTPDGIKKTISVSPKASTSKKTGKKLNKVIIVVLSLAVIFLLIDRFVLAPNYINKEKLNEKKAFFGEKTLAVLPLKNWSGNPDFEYISDGMTDAIINKLNKIESIQKVIPYTSITKYKDTNKSIKEIATELGVSNILQGSFQLSGNELSIKLQMINGDEEKQFWDKEYSDNWVGDEIFRLQAKVAKGIADGINAEVSDIEKGEINLISTNNKEAYSLFLQGNHEYSKATKLGFDNAIRLYEEAISLDSTFVDAYLKLSGLWQHGGAIWGSYDPIEASSKAKENLKKAQLLAPEKSEVTDLLLRIYLFIDRDFDKLEKDYEKTLVAPLYLIYVGKYQEAVEYMEEADHLKRADGPLYSQWSAEAFYHNNKWQNALNIYKDDFALYNDDYNWLRESTKYLYYLGEYQMARERLDRLKQIFPDRPPIIIWLDAVLYDALGKESQSKIKLEELKLASKENAFGSPNWFIALYYFHKKKYNRGFDWLYKAYEKGSGEFIWLHSEPLLKPVRKDPRYIDLHKKIGFPIPPISE